MKELNKFKKMDKFELTMDAWERNVVQIALWTLKEAHELHWTLEEAHENLKDETSLLSESIIKSCEDLLNSFDGYEKAIEALNEDLKKEKEENNELE